MNLNAKIKCTLLLAWGLGISCSMGVLYVYANTPGQAVDPSLVSWPSKSLLEPPSSDRPTLLLFVHPKCSCSLASLGELERLMVFLSGKMDVRIVFFESQKPNQNWFMSNSFQKAMQIPSVEVILDSQGQTARTFGVHTSGQTLLFSRDGKLIFAGGITTSRGHRGDSLGREIILASIHDPARPKPQSSSVYGCSMEKLAGNFKEFYAQ